MASGMTMPATKMAFQACKMAPQVVRTTIQAGKMAPQACKTTLKTRKAAPEAGGMTIQTRKSTDQATAGAVHIGRSSLSDSSTVGLDFPPIAPVLTDSCQELWARSMTALAHLHAR
jgi:hypothetical protein